MKVYVIISEEYLQDYCSDHHVEAVSLYKDEAEIICATLNNDRESDFCEIEEYDTEDIKPIEQNELKERFCMRVEYETENERGLHGGILLFDERNTISVYNVYNNRRYSHLIEIIATFPKGTTEDEVRKIMYDRFVKFKAERGEL